MKRPPRKRKPIHYLWVSFAAQEKNHGMVLIRARDLEEAMPMMSALGLIPKDFPIGGQVAAITCPDDFEVPEEAANKLLTREDLRKYFPKQKMVNSRGQDVP